MINDATSLVVVDDATSLMVVNDATFPPVLIMDPSLICGRSTDGYHETKG